MNKSNRSKRTSQSILAFPTSNKRTTCKVCEMTYNLHIPSDKEIHNKYHTNFVNGIIWPITLIENGLDNFTLLFKSPSKSTKRETIRASIFTIDKNNKKQVQKVDQLLGMVNKELNAADDSKQWKNIAFESSKAFVAVIYNKAVGLCTTDLIDSEENSKWMIHSTQTIVPNQTNPRAKIGISRIWIAPKWRQYGIATRLLNIVMENSIYGVRLMKSQIAFSQPSTNGGLLAKSFNGVVHKKSGEILIPVYIEN
ncbi:ECO1 [[Candida] subhashii]|uniref:N-acetyltransferase ECO1 n=1 Tax=[Candida] subhashii TaxID=561895 RepID=A0A8J5QIU9_9ASCO|nr:ECO1 [[Candida] subhashii]KAG7665481.1 ECO1 [[Candida] subhashii]